MVYHYARTIGYDASVGRIGALECDFVLRREAEGYAYVQVAMTIADPATEGREFRPFGRIRDGYPRYLLTMDRLLQRRDGVRHENIIDFVAEGREF